MATWLQAAGYRTGLVGKWLNNYHANEDYLTDVLAARAVQFLRDTEADDAQPWFRTSPPPRPISISSRSAR